MEKRVRKSRATAKEKVVKEQKPVEIETKEEVIEPIVELPVEPIVETVLVTEIETPKQIVTEEPKKPAPIKWKKIGRGTFLLGNRYIKQGQIFTATLEEVPKAFRDVIVPVNTFDEPAQNTDKTKEEVIVPPEKVVNSEYSLKQDTATKLWNIVDKRGKKLNESPLSEPDANALLKVL